MAKGEITINSMMCQGCGYCAQYCPKQCIEFVDEKMTERGYLLPTVTKPEECTGCTICGWMCPHMAIEVYKFQEETVLRNRGVT